MMSRSTKSNGRPIFELTVTFYGGQHGAIDVECDVRGCALAFSEWGIGGDIGSAAE